MHPAKGPRACKKYRPLRHTTHIIKINTQKREKAIECTAMIDTIAPFTSRVPGRAGDTAPEPTKDHEESGRICVAWGVLSACSPALRVKGESRNRPNCSPERRHAAALCVVPRPPHQTRARHAAHFLCHVALAAEPITCESMPPSPCAMRK